jgi:DUF1680 family protein
MLVGYARVSTTDQNLDLQKDALQAAGCERLFTDTASGAKAERPGQGKLAASLDSTGAHFETPCGAYANVNLDRYLLRFTGDPKYGDNMERVLYNGMLATLPMQPDGKTFYYSDYRPGTKKAYFRDVWPCCSGTYAQITAD